MLRGLLFARSFFALLGGLLLAGSAVADPVAISRQGIYTVLPPAPGAVAGSDVAKAAATSALDYDPVLRLYSRRRPAPAMTVAAPGVSALRLAPIGQAAVERGWPMRAEDPANTGHTAASGPAVQTQPQWTFRPDPSTFVWRPAVARDGTIYVTTVSFGPAGLDGRLYALRPDGSVKWQAALTNSSGQSVWASATPALDEAGNIYIAWAHDQDFGGLTAISLDSNGTIRWRFEPNIELAFASHQEPVLANGVLYAATDTSFFLEDLVHRGSVFALDLATGSQLWRWISPNLDTFFSGPAVGRDGHLYHASASNTLRGASGHLYRVRPNGEMDWTVAIGEGVNATPVVDAHNNIYLGDLVGVASKHSSAGAPLWRYDTASGQIFASPMLNGDRVTIGGASAGLHVLAAATGERVALFAPGEFPLSQISDRVGNAFFYGFDGTVFGFGRGGRQWWTFDTDVGASVNAVAIAADGRLLVGNTETLKAYAAPVLGDLNCDGAVNVLDIQPFIVALTDASRYARRFPGCHRSLADVDGDNTIDAFDLVPFLSQLR